MSLFNVKKFEDAVELSKKIKKIIVITRGEKGAIAINDSKVTECSSKKNLNIVDLTGAGDFLQQVFSRAHKW